MKRILWALKKAVAEPKDPTKVGQEGNKLNFLIEEVDMQKPKGAKKVAQEVLEEKNQRYQKDTLKER